MNEKVCMYGNPMVHPCKEARLEVIKTSHFCEVKTINCELFRTMYVMRQNSHN